MRLILLMVPLMCCGRLVRVISVTDTILDNAERACQNVQPRVRNRDKMDLRPYVKVRADGSLVGVPFVDRFEGVNA
jgi:hypothetical protein